MASIKIIHETKVSLNKLWPLPIKNKIKQNKNKNKHLFLGTKKMRFVWKEKMQWKFTITSNRLDFLFYTTIFKIAINPKISIYTEMIIYISYDVFSAIKKDHDVHVNIYFVHSTIIYSLSFFFFICSYLNCLVIRPTWSLISN